MSYIGKQNVGKTLVQSGKAKLPVLGMLMLDQKSGKREMGGFDHPGNQPVCMGQDPSGGRLYG